ncbi:MAG: HipA domain-containing protein [Burkholderiaceae bacterium]
MKQRTLVATIDEHRVGTLHADRDLWSFQYDSAWVQGPASFALSPALPLQSDPVEDGGSRRPVQWYFDNLLPEEGQRKLLAQSAGLPDEADAFALLAHYGAESAGSLTLLPPDEPQAGSGLCELSDAELEARIAQLPAVPLGQHAPKRMSLAGAQHKLAIVDRDGRFFEPEGRTASTHILKPDHPDPLYAHSVANEWFTMSLAARLGLPVPAVARRYVPSPVFLVERFDRRPGPTGEWERRHAIDACQLLNISRTFKYSQGSVARLAELAGRCRAPAVARNRLYAWLVFNVLVGNTDAHLKNLSFLVTPLGIELAPFYDLVGTAVYETRAFDRPEWPEATRFSWPILGKRTYADLTRPLLLEAGLELGLNTATARRQLDRQLERMPEQARRLYEQAEEENGDWLRRLPAVGRHLEGEMRCLRALQFTVIGETVRRVSQSR